MSEPMSPQETPEQIRARERAYIMKWMRGVVAEKKTPAEQKAFLSKVHSVVTLHNITLEELLEPEPDKS